MRTLMSGLVVLLAIPVSSAMADGPPVLSSVRDKKPTSIADSLRRARQRRQKRSQQTARMQGVVNTLQQARAAIARYRTARGLVLAATTRTVAVQRLRAFFKAKEAAAALRGTAAQQVTHYVRSTSRRSHVAQVRRHFDAMETDWRRAAPETDHQMFCSVAKRFGATLPQCAR